MTHESCVTTNYFQNSFINTLSCKFSKNKLVNMPPNASLNHTVKFKFLNTNISQGRVANVLRCGRTFNHHYIKWVWWLWKLLTIFINSLWIIMNSLWIFMNSLWIIMNSLLVLVAEELEHRLETGVRRPLSQLVTYITANHRRRQSTNDLHCQPITAVLIPYKEWKRTDNVILTKISNSVERI